MGKQKQDIICPCYKIRKSEMKDAIEQGITSFKEFKKNTNIGKKCSSCKSKNKKRFNKYLRKLDS